MNLKPYTAEITALQKDLQEQSGLLITPLKNQALLGFV